MSAPKGAKLGLHQDAVDRVLCGPLCSRSGIQEGADGIRVDLEHRLVEALAHFHGDLGRGLALALAAADDGAFQDTLLVSASAELERDASSDEYLIRIDISRSDAGFQVSALGLHGSDAGDDGGELGGKRHGDSFG